MRRFLHIALMALLLLGTPVAFATASQMAGPVAGEAKSPVDEGCAGAHSDMVQGLAGADIHQRLETPSDADTAIAPIPGARGFAECGAADRRVASAATWRAPIYLLHCCLLR